MNPSQAVHAVRVWDPFVRVFHWSLVSCVILNYFVVEDGETLHQWLGYIAAALVCAWIVWGFIGTRPIDCQTRVAAGGAGLAGRIASCALRSGFRRRVGSGRV